MKSLLAKGIVSTCAKRSSSLIFFKNDSILETQFNFTPVTVKNLCLSAKLNGEINNGRNYHTTTRKLFFNLRNVNQSEIYSEEEQKQLIETHQILDAKFSKLSETVKEYRLNHPTPIQLTNNDMFVELSEIINTCSKTLTTSIGRANSADMDRFFKSNIGMKIYVLMKKSELLMFKMVVQEWFPIETLKIHFEQDKVVQPLPSWYPPEYPIDDIVYLCGAYYCSLSNSAFIPPSNITPITKENLIAGALYLFERFKNLETLEDEHLIEYAESLFSVYETAKKAYTTASKIENESEFHYNADKNAYSYLGRTYTENEFDYFEDLETNIPLHLGNFIRALKAIFFCIQDGTNPFSELEECINADPKNIYIHYLKAMCWNNLETLPKDALKAKLKGVSHLEKALDYLSTSPILPLPNLGKADFSATTRIPEIHVERINDLKFSPISLLLATMYSTAAHSSLSTDLRFKYGEKSVQFIRQTELYSRTPNHALFYLLKGTCYNSCEMFELAIRSYVAIQKFEGAVNLNLIIDSICYASRCMVYLGKTENIIKTIDFFIKHYGNNPRLLMQRIQCKDFLCKSKDELRQVLKEYQECLEIIKESESSNPYSYYQARFEGEDRVRKIQERLTDPQVPEIWN